MIIGRMDRRIRLYNPALTTIERNPLGEIVNTFGPYKTVAAGKRTLSVKEKFMSDHLQGEITHIFTIRWNPEVKETWRIEFESETYEVVAPPREIGRHEGMELYARLVR